MGKEKKDIKISVVTVCLNDKQKLEKTILNVLGQDYKNKEFIIIDGGSSDGTTEVIKKYEPHIHYWVSEKDNGIYDAMNKGIKVATGDYIYFLNAGDLIYGSHVFKKMAEIIKNNENIGIIYGLAECFSKEDAISYISGAKINRGDLWKGMPVCHQSIFFKKELFNIIGFYNTKFKSRADYELLLRFFYNQKKHGLGGCFVDMPICKFNLYGYSSKNYLRNLDGIRNVSHKYHRFNNLQKLYFSIKKMKFFLLVVMKKLKITGLYRKVKYNVIYKKIKKKEYD